MPEVADYRTQNTNIKRIIRVKNHTVRTIYIYSNENKYAYIFFFLKT